MDFGIRRRSCNQSPVDTKEQLSIWGESKVIRRFSTAHGAGAPDPHVAQGSTVLTTQQQCEQGPGPICIG